jgi:hypothetical protein
MMWVPEHAKWKTGFSHLPKTLPFQSLMRNNSGEFHTQLKGDRLDTQGVHRIFWNGHSECLARTFTRSEVPLDRPGGTTTIAPRGRESTGGTTNNSSSNSFSFSSSTP